MGTAEKEFPRLEHPKHGLEEDLRLCGRQVATYVPECTAFSCLCNVPNSSSMAKGLYRPATTGYHKEVHQKAHSIFVTQFWVHSFDTRFDCDFFSDFRFLFEVLRLVNSEDGDNPIVAVEDEVALARG